MRGTGDIVSVSLVLFCYFLAGIGAEPHGAHIWEDCSHPEGSWLALILERSILTGSHRL